MDMTFELWLANEINEVNHGFNNFWELNESELKLLIEKSRRKLLALTMMIMDDVSKKN